MLSLIASLSLFSVSGAQGVAQLTGQRKQNMLDCTNILRCMVGHKPLVWDDSIAQEAVNRQKQGKGHGKQHTLEGSQHYAENLASDSGDSVGLLQECVRWYNEAHSIGTGGMIGHFSAMVWVYNDAMGCSVNTPGDQVMCLYRQPEVSRAKPNALDGSLSKQKRLVLSGWNEAKGTICNRTQSECESDRAVNSQGQGYCLPREVKCGTNDGGKLGAVRDVAPVCDSGAPQTQPTQPPQPQAPTAVGPSTRSLSNTRSLRFDEDSVSVNPAYSIHTASPSTRSLSNTRSLRFDEDSVSVNPAYSIHTAIAEEAEADKSTSVPKYLRASR